MWPYTSAFHVDTWDDGNLWGYVSKTIRFASAIEAAVFLAGHESYHFLRHSRQVPGKNTQVQANRFGLKWLEEFRNESSKASY